MSGCRSVGICLCLFIVSIFATIITVITLSFVHRNPKLYIQNLYIPSLNNSTQSNTTMLNTSIFIDLKFVRLMPLSELRFDDFNLTLFYGSNRSAPVAAQTTVRGFNLGLKRRARKKAAVEARALPWEDALRRVSGGEAVALVVELAVKSGYKNCDYDPPHKCTWSEGEVEVVAGDVWVDASGHKVSKKPIRLR